MDNDDPCQNFSQTTSSTSQLDLPASANKKKDKKSKTKKQSEQEQTSPQCSNILTSSTTSSSTTISMGAFNSEHQFQKVSHEPPHIGYEVSIAKSVLQQYSTLSGDNLYDHISDIVKRVIDERPPNVIDFFEEFSRNVREQKFHVQERFPPNGAFADCRMFRPAKRILHSIKLPSNIESIDMGCDEELPSEEAFAYDGELQIDIDNSMRMFVTFNERVEQLQFYWNQCGFSISKDDIFQLAGSINRLQTHPSIMQCRFWGCINGLKASYYIVEASLSRDEVNSRLTMMDEEMKEKQLPFRMRKDHAQKPVPPHIGPELTPGIYGWEKYPAEDLEKMIPKAEPVPLAQEIEFYDIPPEYIGKGCNRFSYFVVNCLYDDWIELPIVTPRQIAISRQIKKFFTGDLEADVISYPCFPGKEKHYLRAMIARITAGTHIAPQGYYRRMTKKEQNLFDGINVEEGEEEEEEEENFNEDEEEGIQDNDVMLMKNEGFEIEPLNSLATTVAWVHCRPNILNQGRVVWYDEEKARKEREKALALYLKMRLMEEMVEEVEDEDDEGEEEGDEEEMIEGFVQPEMGPEILSSCAGDINDECGVPWLVRFTSKYTNQKERLLVLQSNVWPGAFTFIFENTCESVYLGWGHKFCTRNIPFKHLALVQEEFPHGPEDFIESTDPSIEEELAYNEWLMSKQKQREQMAEDFHDYEGGDVDEDYDNDDNDEDEY